MPYQLQNSVTPNDDAEDRPFRMTEMPLSDLNERHEMTDALQILSQGRTQAQSLRNRFFGGICLALPLSALLWYLIYHFAHRLAE